jgi:hypothetical protein
MLLDTHTGPDGTPYVTRKHAAELMGVAPVTITTWCRRGYLKPIEGCPPRRLLFSLDDVAEAERLAREAALRTSGSEERVVRRFAAA